MFLLFIFFILFSTIADMTGTVIFYSFIIVTFWILYYCWMIHSFFNVAK